MGWGPKLLDRSRAPGRNSPEAYIRGVVFSHGSSDGELRRGVVHGECTGSAQKWA